MTTDLILPPSPVVLPAQIFTPTPKAAKRVLEFFTAQINNDHTRKAYLNVVSRFSAWCDGSRDRRARGRAVILGHGLKDIGGKNSFAIRLNTSICEDSIKTLSPTFNANWNAASPLP